MWCTGAEFMQDGSLEGLVGVTRRFADVEDVGGSDVECDLLKDGVKMNQRAWRSAYNWAVWIGTSCGIHAVHLTLAVKIARKDAFLHRVIRGSFVSVKKGLDKLRCYRSAVGRKDNSGDASGSFRKDMLHRSRVVSDERVRNVDDALAFARAHRNGENGEREERK